MTDTAESRPLRITPEGKLDDPGLRHDPALARLLAVLDHDGEEARIVGGAVRNGLLGLPHGDVDVATTAAPGVVIARAKAARLRVIPTGIAHGTVTVLVGKASFEVTTLREDIETDGRHAVVRFGRDFLADAQRRDFTINALSLKGDGTIHDTTGGVADLAAGRVRFIGEADLRIQEDYLRILRFFRFSAAYGRGALDAEGLEAASRHRDGLARLSRERIRAELIKLLKAERAAEAVRAMDGAGVLPLVLGGESWPDRLARLAALESTRGSEPDALLRLVALAARTLGDLRRLRDGLRLSNGEQSRLAAAIDARWALEPARPPAPRELRALLFSHGLRAARDGLDLAAIDGDPGHAEAWAEASRFVADEPPPRLPLGGVDVMARGVRSGRMVGAVLKRLQADWIRAGFPASPIVLAELLDAAVAAERASAELMDPLAGPGAAN